MSDNENLINAMEILVRENERLQAEVDFLRGNQTVCLEEINRLRGELKNVPTPASESAYGQRLKAEIDRLKKELEAAEIPPEDRR